MNKTILKEQMTEQEFERWARENVKFTRGVAYRLERIPDKRDDLENDALLKLWKMVNGPIDIVDDEHMKALFTKAAKWQQIDRARTESRRSHLWHTIPDFDVTSELLGPSTSDDYPCELEVMLEDELLEAWAQMTPVQAEVVSMHVLGGKLQREIAEQMGVTDGRVSQIAKAGLDHMRQYLTRDEQQKETTQC